MSDTTKDQTGAAATTTETGGAQDATTATAPATIDYAPQIAELRAKVEVLERTVTELQSATKAIGETAAANASAIRDLKSGAESLGEVQVQQAQEIETLKKQADVHDLAIEQVQTRSFPKPLEDKELRAWLLKYGIG